MKTILLHILAKKIDPSQYCCIQYHVKFFLMVIVKVKTEHTIFSWNSVLSQHVLFCLLWLRIYLVYLNVYGCGFNSCRNYFSYFLPQFTKVGVFCLKQISHRNLFTTAQKPVKREKFFVWRFFFTIDGISIPSKWISVFPAYPVFPQITFWENLYKIFIFAMLGGSMVHHYAKCFVFIKIYFQIWIPSF